jgi:hypothetical protein
MTRKDSTELTRTPSRRPGHGFDFSTLHHTAHGGSPPARGAGGESSAGRTGAPGAWAPGTPGTGPVLPSPHVRADVRSPVTGPPGRLWAASAAPARPAARPPRPARAPRRARPMDAGSGPAASWSVCHVRAARPAGGGGCDHPDRGPAGARPPRRRAGLSRLRSARGAAGVWRGAGPISRPLPSRLGAAVGIGARPGLALSPAAPSGRTGYRFPAPVRPLGPARPGPDGASMERLPAPSAEHGPGLAPPCPR